MPNSLVGAHVVGNEVGGRRKTPVPLWVNLFPGGKPGQQLNNLQILENLCWWKTEKWETVLFYMKILPWCKIKFEFEMFMKSTGRWTSIENHYCFYKASNMSKHHLFRWWYLKATTLKIFWQRFTLKQICQHVLLGFRILYINFLQVANKPYFLTTVFSLITNSFLSPPDGYEADAVFFLLFSFQK